MIKVFFSYFFEVIAVKGEAIYSELLHCTQ